MAKKEMKSKDIAVEKDILEDAMTLEPYFLKEIDTGKKLFSDVEPEFRFWLSDGRVIKNLTELAHALKTMNEDTFRHHVTKDKNDFCAWIKDVLKHPELAESIKKIRNKDEMAHFIESRKKDLDKKVKHHEQKKLAEKAEIEHAIEKVKEKESALETAVIKEKHSHKADRMIKPVGQIVAKLNTAIIAKEKEDLKNIVTLKKEYTESDTLRKLSNLRELVGLTPIASKEKSNQKSKVMITSQKIKNIAVPEKKAIPSSKLMIKSPKIKENSEIKSLREKERELLEKEQWIDQEEKNLNQKRTELSKMRVELIKQRNELEQIKFASFIKRKTRMEEQIIGEKEITLPEVSYVEQGELTKDLNLARDLLNSGANEEAGMKIRSIKQKLASMLLSQEEKRNIEYALMELEADVKLAML